MKKVSVSIDGHQTSFTLESEFLKRLKEIAEYENTSLAKIVKGVDSARSIDVNLSSALRVFVLKKLSQESKQSEQPKG